MDKPVIEQTIKEQQSIIDNLQKKLDGAELRQRLTAAILSAQNKSIYVAEYFEIIENDFYQLLNQSNILEDKINIWEELRNIGSELKNISACPQFYQKRTVAVAGGFSAGKSQFINSLLKEKIRLPTGINPTTAIPTYVFNGQENNVLGCNNEGGMVNLLEIDKDFQRKLSHGFIYSLGFNLKKIMPFIFLQTSLAYENLCFVDTPGYNPSRGKEGYTHEDVQTAKEFIQSSSAILWLIGLDSNGTIPNSDLEFLEEVLEVENDKPLYIVLNKADIISFDTLREIIEDLVEIIPEDINVAGISAYSSSIRKEYLYERNSLFSFLEQMNQPSDKQHNLLDRVLELDKKIQQSVLRRTKENKLIVKYLKTIPIDVLKEGLDDLTFKVDNKINMLSKVFTDNERYLKELGIVIDKIMKCIDSIFACASIKERKILDINLIEVDPFYNRLIYRNEEYGKAEDSEKMEFNNFQWGRWENIFDKYNNLKLNKDSFSELCKLKIFTISEYAKLVKCSFKIAVQEITFLKSKGLIDHYRQPKNEEVQVGIKKYVLLG